MMKDFAILLAVIFFIGLALYLTYVLTPAEKPPEIVHDTTTVVDTLTVELPADSSGWQKADSIVEVKDAQLEEFRQILADYKDQIEKLHKSAQQSPTVGKPLGIKLITQKANYELSAGTVEVETKSVLPYVSQRIKFTPKPVSFIKERQEVKEIRIIEAKTPFYKTHIAGIVEGIGVMILAIWGVGQL
jgi:hypothetical protein